MVQKLYIGRRAPDEGVLRAHEVGAGVRSRGDEAGLLARDDRPVPLARRRRRRTGAAQITDAP